MRDGFRCSYCQGVCEGILNYVATVVDSYSGMVVKPRGILVRSLCYL